MYDDIKAMISLREIPEDKKKALKQNIAELERITSRKKSIKAQLKSLRKKRQTLKTHLAIHKARRGIIWSEIQNIMAGLKFEVKLHLAPDDVNIPSTWWRQARKIKEAIH